MPELSVIIQWMNQYPKTGWLLLCIYIALGVVRHRVINAESGSIFRGLLNLRKRRLEQMLTQPYLNKMRSVWQSVSFVSAAFIGSQACIIIGCRIWL